MGAKTQKQLLREKIERDLAEFESEGGEITHPAHEDNAFYRRDKKPHRKTNGASKLNDREVRYIRDMVKPDDPMMQRISNMTVLASKFGVSYYTIRAAANNETYKDVA